MLEQAVAAFEQEARDILAKLEAQLLQLEAGADPALVDALFRGLHTLKGSGAMFGYTALADFVHHLETAYDRVRAGILPVDRALIDLSLEAADVIAAFLDAGGDGDRAATLAGSDGVTALVTRIAAFSGDAAHTPGIAPAPAPIASGPQAFRIRFRPHAEALRNGMRPDLLMRELAELGEVAVTVDAADLPDLEALDPAQAALTWHVSLEGPVPREAVEDVFLFADDADLSIEATPAPTPAPAPTRQPFPAAGSAPQGLRPQPQDTIRIASARLDDMMDSIGELVIAQARLDAVGERLGDSTLASVVEEVGRLVLGLRDATLSIRMLPLEQVFGKFRRVVRDLSAELGKDVDYVTEGGETEIDKTVIDRIGDPLVHMIRNALDHGIETADARVESGKPPRGTLRLGAWQEGGEILLRIADDGRGLDTAAIRARAVDRGLLSPDATPTDRELQAMIFEPGFSTAATVSAVSGRGVGMDAVRSSIDALGGSVDVSSTLGQGTCVTLRLPVTMAIVDGLRVRVGRGVYVVPLSAVEECVEMDAGDVARRSGRSVLRIRDDMVPFLRLDALFGLAEHGAPRRRVVVVRVDGARIGLVVDDILGQGQTVIKSLGPYHRDIPGMGGATILGDGRVALILDVATLVRWAEAQPGPDRRAVA